MSPGPSRCLNYSESAVDTASGMPMSSKCSFSLRFYVINEAVFVSIQVPWRHENLPYLFRDVWPPRDLIYPLLNTKVLKYLLCKISCSGSSSGSRALPIGTDWFLDFMHLGSKAVFSDNFKPLAKVLSKCSRF